MYVRLILVPLTGTGEIANLLSSSVFSVWRKKKWRNILVALERSWTLSHRAAQ